ncbi:ATP-binding SpoIIE family protein phosphatase [Streptomyces sp. NPDC051954]|uniref:ATP-binding SpoIIE family protein phosphatase n=1 Tax=unclassified Streptomyces TaxID=2593676 RepID=UPI003438962A
MVEVDRVRPLEGDATVVFLSEDLCVLNAALDPATAGSTFVSPGIPLAELVPGKDRETALSRLKDVLATGRPSVDPSSRRWRLQVPGGPLYVALSVVRSVDIGGRPTLAVTLLNVSQQTSQAGRLQFLKEASEPMGTSLDVLTTARQLAEVLVPGLGDFAIVSLATEISTGEEPPNRTGGGNVALRRAALAPAGREWPEGFLLEGEDLPPLPNQEVIRAYQRGQAFSLTGRASITAVHGDDPAMIRAMVPAAGELSVACAPLVTERGQGAPGLLLGSIEVWRRASFDDVEVRLLQGEASRAAVAIDNARRYTRERRMSLALQQSLLPRTSGEMVAAQTAGAYLPTAAAGRHELGGDWYDVIALSGVRVALVVGDVVGHGQRAVAMMGRLRTAVQTLADQDLAPDELVTHLDDLVARIDAESPESPLGSTCLYVIYDPITRTCSMASAGHPPPILVHPDGRASLVDIQPGPVLGLGGHPFEVVEFKVAPGSVLALYSDGLIEHPDIDTGIKNLVDRLSGVSPDDAPEAIVSRLVEGKSATRDDATALVARLREMPPGSVAAWELAAEESAVATARKSIRQHLAETEASDELSFTTELAVSELVTNAVRYGGGSSVTLRLIREGDRLICEVSDPSSTAPHLKRAHSDDEGGRGLFIVAQTGRHWGVRFTDHGKIIWTELLWR